MNDQDRDVDDQPPGARPGLDELEEKLVAEKYAHKLIRTLRVRLSDEPGMLAKVATAIGEQEGLIGDIVILAIDSHAVERSVTVYVDDSSHLHAIMERVRSVPGVTVEAVEDDVLKLHERGKLRVESSPKIETLRDLQKVYTPGVASVSQLILREPGRFRDYTWVDRTVAIVTDGSAVLGLGNIGAKAALPVLEGKALLLDQLAGVGCVPILLDTQDTAEIIATVGHIAQGFGAVLLEDISAPRCFEIESSLAERLDVPVFHDDQHGTAVVTLAALINACAATGTELESLRLVISGVGAAGAAIAKLLVAAGVSEVICCDRAGAIHEGRSEHMNSVKHELSRLTNASRAKGPLAEVLAGAEAFVGVSAPGIVTKQMVASMSEPRIVFAMANPLPEIMPAEAMEAGASVAMDGRTVNNALAFPGIIRGALDAGATSITDSMKLAAAKAIAQSAPEGMLLPSVLDRQAHAAVADAVAQAGRSR